MRIMIFNPAFPKDTSQAQALSKLQLSVVHDYFVGEINRGKIPKDAVIVQMLTDAGHPLDFSGATPAPPPPLQMWMHTPKAVKAGHPSNRVFLVYCTGPKTSKTDLIAWKCTITLAGLEHPAFEQPLMLTEQSLRLGNIKEGKNGSKPTAVFRPDSFYRKVTVAELDNIW